ncbi:MAG: hypothetical protein KKD33_03345 [Verrucomicrobia bacterium]|nr:hypothetical protein [Verrucomicrobiota bacterium]
MKLAFVMQDMPHWHEYRNKDLCFEYLYEALSGYSFSFDPYLLTALGEVPSLVEKNDFLARLEDFGAVVSPQRALTEALHARWPENKPALWVDPPAAIAAIPCKSRNPDWVLGMHEKIVFTPNPGPAFLRGHDYYCRRGFWAFEPGPGDIVIGWVGERPIWMVSNRRGYGSINNLFRLSGQTLLAESAAAFITAYVRALLAVLGRPFESVPPLNGKPENVRRDFHAFGACLALLAFGMREAGHDPDELRGSFAPIMQGAQAAVAGRERDAREALREAFGFLHATRQRHFPFERGCIDVPHAGVIGPDGGIAELEWPELTRNYLADMCAMAEAWGYRWSMEYNTGSLVQTARRHPEIIRRLGRLWRANKIDLVNGSWSGPLQQYTDIELAAREFEIGQDAMQKLFGRRCETYAAQEFSLMPSFPGLLRDFGFKRAAHLAQNRGRAPASKHNRFNWRGKDGRVIAALGQHPLDLTNRGVNFYLEWPTMFMGCLKQGLTRLDSLALQDQSRLFFREEMVRAEQYAPVLGRHVTIPDVLPDGPDADLPVESFMFDEYTFEMHCNGPICYQWISIFEKVLAYAHWATRVEQLAAAAALDSSADLAPVWEWILYLEAHDTELVPKGTAGDFYSRGCMDYFGPHYNINTEYFGKLLADRAPEMEAALSRVERAALTKLGLKPVSGGKAPRKVALHNPYAQPLGPGGWFPWSGKDFTAVSAGVRLTGWNGRCYWSGTLPAGESVWLKTAPPVGRRWSGKRPKPALGWELRPDGSHALRAIPADGVQGAVSLIPEDGKKSVFRRTALQYAGNAGFAATRVTWIGKDRKGWETTINADFVQLAGCPLVFVHIAILGYEFAVSTNKEFNEAGTPFCMAKNALRLRFTPCSRLQRVQYFVSHFTETSRKTRQTSSPYVALAETGQGALAILNRGSIWHVRKGKSLDFVLMVPYEITSRRDLAFGWNIGQPVTTAIRQMDPPVLAIKGGTTSAAPMTVRAECADVWISSVRPDGQARLSETAGARTEVRLRVTPPPAVVEFLGERGAKHEKPELSADGIVRFTLNPYESAAIRIRRSKEINDR